MWWQRKDLRFVDGRLELAGSRVADLAREMGTPLFLYNARRIEEKVRSLESALNRRGLEHRIFYAMKANRFVPLLAHLRRLGICGIDACSPREVRLARQVGFPASDISFTSTAVSDRDFDAILRSPSLRIHCDSASSVRRLGRAASMRRLPGLEMGLRIDPGLGIGYRQIEKLRYGGRHRSKLGISLNDLPQVLTLARREELVVTGIHVHAGCGYLTPQLAVLEQIVDRVRSVCRQIPSLEYVNIGGGLGVPLDPEDRPLDLDAWTEILARRLGDLGLVIHVEPGDFLVKDSGVLVCEVNTVELKDGVRFLGIDAGFQLQNLPTAYGVPLEAVACEVNALAPATSAATIAGNINEACDLFAIDVELPTLEEGSFLALLNAGGYGSSMSSDHCLKGNFTEMLV